MEEDKALPSRNRKEELETALKGVDELINTRSTVLAQFEKNYLARIFNNTFTQLKRASERPLVNFLFLNKQTIENELKMWRRNLFYLQKRRKDLIVELEELTKDSNISQKAS